MNRRLLYGLVCIGVLVLGKNVFCAAEELRGNPFKGPVFETGFDAVNAVLESVRLSNDHGRGFDSNSTLSLAKTKVLDSLMAAIKQGKIEDVEALLTKETNKKISNGLGGAALINRYGEEYSNSPLGCAAFTGQEHMVRSLLDHKANIELGDENFRPLHEAAMLGHLSMAQFLIENNADIEACSKENQFRPLHAAVQCCQQPMAELLLELKANVNALDCNQQTPLYYAALKNNEAGVDLLLRNGADTSRVYEEGGRTVLYLTVKKGLDCIVKRLLQEKAPYRDRKEAFEMVHANFSRNIGVEKAKILMRLLAIRSCSNGACKTFDYGDTYKACSQCNNVYYCGKVCQKADWKLHKLACKALALGNVEGPEGVVEEVTRALVEQKALGVGTVEKVVGIVEQALLSVEQALLLVDQKIVAQDKVEQESEQDSKLQSQLLQKQKEEREQKEKREQQSNDLKEAVRTDNKKETERLLGLGHVFYPNSERWNKKLAKLLNPEKEETVKPRKPETSTGGAKVGKKKVQREHGDASEVHKSKKSALAVARHAADGAVQGFKKLAQKDGELDRLASGKSAKPGRLLEAPPLSISDRMSLSGMGAGPIEQAAQIQEDERAVQKKNVFTLLQDSEHKAADERVHAEQEADFEVVFSHPQYGIMLLDIDHVCVGQPGINGGLHLDYGRKLENAGLLRRTPSPFDQMKNGCYRAKKAGELDGRGNTFFPSTWNRRDLKIRLEQAFVADENVHPYTDKKGDTCMVGCMPNVAGERGDLTVLSSIYFLAIIKRNMPGVIRTVYPLTENEYMLECLKSR